MTVLFNSDFEDSSGTVTVPTGMAGWAFSAGSWIVFNASIVSLTAVNGSRVSGGADTGDNVYYTSSGLITDQAIRHAAKWQSHATPQVVGHILRRVNANNFYYAYPETDGANLRCTIVRYQFGSTTLATSSYSLAVSVGDVIHHETKIVGTSIESRIWKNSDARPSTATVTATDSAFSSGYPGMVKRGAGSYYAAADQVVVTDAAGGEDYYYSSGLTLTPGLFTNTNTFYSPTVTYDQTLTPGLYTNTNAFYSATVSLSGGAQSLTPGLFSNTNTFHAATVARVPGFLTPVLKNNTGTVLASESGVACNVYNASTGALVVRKTGLTSSAAGIVSVTDAAMAAGTTYAYEIVLSAARRLPVAAA